jgi:hypothetical protein
MVEGTNGANDAPGAWGEDESKVFVEFGRALVPGREEILSLPNPTSRSWA